MKVQELNHLECGDKNNTKGIDYKKIGKKVFQDALD